MFESVVLNARIASACFALWGCGRRRATRSGVTPMIMNALADSGGGGGGGGDGVPRFGAGHRQSRSMSVSLEAVARAVQFTGVGKEVRRDIVSAARFPRRVMPLLRVSCVCVYVTDFAALKKVFFCFCLA